MKKIRDCLYSLVRGIYKAADLMSKGPEYSEHSNVTYGLGSTLVSDILTMCPERINRIYIRDDLRNDDPYVESIIALAEGSGIPVVHTEDEYPKKLGRRQEMSCEIEKRSDRLQPGNHIVMVNPAIPRNVATVIRAAVAFGYHDIAIIREQFDTYSPALLRVSMGSRLRVRAECFDTIEDYMERFPENARYAFMLYDTAEKLGSITPAEPHSLIFGNERHGLPPEYADFCRPVFIEQSSELDSLNVSVAATIAMYKMSRADL